MEKRDYLMDQIERFGRALSELLARAMGGKGPGKTEVLVDEMSQTLQEELGLDLDGLLAIPESAFIPFLVEEKQVPEARLHLLADLFFELADGLDTDQPTPLQIQLYNRALMLYTHLDANSNTFSYDRQSKMDRIQAYFMALDRG